MKPASEPAARRQAGLWGAAGAALLGLLAWAVPGPRDWLNALSFDSFFLFRKTQPVADVVMVAMDEASHQRLGQKQGELWDRTLHARLLDELLRRGARAVVFDIVFADAWADPAVDQKFADALQRATGKVALAASASFTERRGEAGGAFNVLQPLERFASVAPWGVVELPRDADGTLRRHAAWPQHPNLATRTAELLGAAPPDQGRARWINYYGPLAFPQVSYWQVLEPDQLPPDVFSNRVVFVGRSFAITSRGPGSGDEHPTPLTRWSGQALTGVELQATVFTNVLHHDWLEQLPAGLEALALGACGALFGFFLAQLRPLAALAWAAAGALLGVVVTWVLFGTLRIWFPWLMVMGVQIPVATGWYVLAFVLRATRAKDIPDHDLLRCVGRGAFGEVWLARNAIGGFHAVKIIHRKNFPNAEPFEREFKGMQTFAPLSRSHPGLVHILHVGRNDLRGCFYYVMEAADDEVSGEHITADHYTPRTLARATARRGRLPVRESVQLGLQLTSALDHLHRKDLVHCDIKPANIIFVGGQPKLADVGLVTSARREGELTRIGTSGFLAPEGPGTPGADIFALGKTLYEAATGCDGARFPELPADLNAGPEADALLQLHEILLTACETDPADRYASAAAMRADLLDLQRALVASPQKT
jgi:CHASE2 domain-containing sensor protein